MATIPKNLDEPNTIKMQLSKNFSLAEMTRSDKAQEYNIQEQYNPSAQVIQNLSVLCQECLQPIRDFLEIQIIVSSGYRCFRVNRIVRGVYNSQHLFGEAADLKTKNLTNEQLIEKILESGVEFDQLIEEFGMWVHISYRKGNNRKQVLRAVKINERTKYIPYKKQ